MDVVVVEVEAEVVVMVTRMAGANTMNPDTIRETIITLGEGDDLAVLPCTTTIMEEAHGGHAPLQLELFIVIDTAKASLWKLILTRAVSMIVMAKWLGIWLDTIYVL
ncbi:hypothetical protein ACMD2_27129 [Ananas comosus]|uniref:Uncharacterized protein n=1 Tax=Ananas comosus TaxID=4615 RepID=A0A199UYY3_ANACO|nr:hypothetical protein ACMD2_27129 [Ananas comosus]